MIDIKEAVQKAIVFVGDVLQDDRAKSVLLEEIELSEDGKMWMITISLPTPSSPLAALKSVQIDARDYKAIQLDSSTGAIKSFRIRKI